jgi:hypothetical protein
VSIYLNLILTKEAVIETGISDFGAGDWWSWQYWFMSIYQLCLFIATSLSSYTCKSPSWSGLEISFYSSSSL